MSSAHEELFKDKEYCFSEIRNARDMMCKTSFTEAQYEGITRGLALMYLYCAEEIQSIVEATMNEAHIRLLYIK